MAKLTMPLAFLLALPALACGGAPAREASTPSRSVASEEPAYAAEPASASEPAAPMKETLAEADQLYTSQLGATRGGQFAVDRQVTELRRAVLLYTQFIERAGNEPEFAPAVKKSRERIEDANKTIEFLLASSEADARAPAEKP